MKKAVVILFILIPALIAVSIFAFPDNALSEQENRVLMTRDEISSNVKDGAFQSDLESFLSDQFPLRDSLAFAQSKIRYITGQMDINGAYICKSGRLIQKVTSADINEEALCSYSKKINSLAKDSRVYVMYVPSAGTVLSEELPYEAPMYDFDKLYSELTGQLENAIIIDIKNELSNPDCYYKTDHHWSAKGAYNAYAAFCRAKGEKAETLDSFKLNSVCPDFQGTLFSKAPIVKTKDEILLPEVSTVSVTADGKDTAFYDLSALETKDKYNVFQGGNHGVVEITNNNAKSDKTLLILKDSFANSFVPFVLQDYSRIIMLDERYTFISLNDYVNSLNPDEILVLREIIN
jgi:regulator of RNase E activity RraB